MTAPQFLQTKSPFKTFSQEERGEMKVAMVLNQPAQERKQSLPSLSRGGLMDMRACRLCTLLIILSFFD
jgi:hypothetical protein